MLNLFLLAVVLFMVANLATMKVEMSDGSFYRPVAETIICAFIVVVCFML